MAEIRPTFSVLMFPGHHLPEHYKGLVFGNWMTSLKASNDFFRLIDRTYYKKMQKLNIERILNHSLSIVRLAALSDDHDVVLGWSLIQGNTLHYVYVNTDLRGQGIATKLVPCPLDIMCITAISRPATSVWNKKLPHAIFTPPI